MAARTWIAILLCLGIWYFYLQSMAPPQQPADKAAKTPTASTSGEAKPEPEPSSVKGLFEQPSRPQETYSVSREKTEVAFSEAGGRIIRVSLKQYHQAVDDNSPPISPVDGELAPFSLATLFSEGEFSDLSSGKYQMEANNDFVRFSRTGKAGVKLVKEYSFGEDPYVINGLFTFTFPSESRKSFGDLILPVGLTTGGGEDQAYSFNDPLRAWELVIFQDNKVTRKTTEDLAGEKETFRGNTQWVAFGNRYFATAVVNHAQLNPDVISLGRDQFSGGFLRYPLRLAKGQKELNLRLQFYVGPKEIDQLSKIGGLRGLVDYGFFSFLAYPLLWLLQYFNKFVHNYGLAIILLTLLVRGLFYPLSVKSYRSMNVMKKLKPQIDALKQKYGDDKEKLSREQINLFKTHKVNPMAGCFPILLQLPVFFALFSVLRDSIDLFHAPFFGWIQDLSSKDPYYIYPVLMGISMFLQMKLTPQVGMDPMQRKIMMAMPIMFTVFMLQLPSGLTIYIFISTLVGIAQQWALSREKEKKPAVAKAPASGARENG